MDAAALRRLLRLVLREEGADLRALTVVLMDHAAVLALNRRHLGHDYLTDVLSFSLVDEDDPPGAVEGEVYVDLDTAAERCAEFGATFEQEAARYAVHGLLHLIGYDDATAEGRAAMRACEDRYLCAAGF